MINEQILKKAIEKAVENGWEDGERILRKFIPVDDITPITVNSAFIFSHEFAKAFWGEVDDGWEDGLEEWQSQLQKMVLEEKPLKYIERFI